MTDKQILGGRGSAKPYTTLNTIEVMLENEKLKEVLKAKEQECEANEDLVNEYFNNIMKLEDRILRLKQVLKEINQIAEDESYVGFWDEQISQILKKCEVLDDL